MNVLALTEPAAVVAAKEKEEKGSKKKKRRGFQIKNQRGKQALCHVHNRSVHHAGEREEKENFFAKKKAKSCGSACSVALRLLCMFALSTDTWYT